MSSLGVIQTPALSYLLRRQRANFDVDGATFTFFQEYSDHREGARPTRCFVRAEGKSEKDLPPPRWNLEVQILPEMTAEAEKHFSRLCDKLKYTHHVATEYVITVAGSMSFVFAVSANTAPRTASRICVEVISANGERKVEGLFNTLDQFEAFLAEMMDLVR